jgi:HPt (histidine-containing phosphotransfer) domain-containing protein
VSTRHRRQTPEYKRAREEGLARLRRWGGDGLAREMRDNFFSGAAGRLESARAGLASGDAGVYAQAMHALRSSSAQIGALAIARLCERAEEKADRAVVDDMTDLLDAIDEELAQFNTWLALALGETR